jgi:general stress protein YciG
MATSKRGFASMDASKQREIASKGGRAAHAKGTAHEFTSDEARVAGRKGGEAVSRDRAHMAAIGREGGHSRGARARAAATGGNVSNPGNTDVAQGSGSQPFVRQANEERSGFEPSRNPSGNSGFGAQERDRDNSPRNERNERNEGGGDNSSFSNRERF